MLFNWAKTKTGQKEADKLDLEFERNGNKKINIDNAIQLDYDYVHYLLHEKHYRGYFNREELDKLFKILDYYPGKIISIN